MKITHFFKLIVLFFGAVLVHAKNSNLNKKIYDSLIQPVFAAKCQECHGDKKSKGKLKLHTKVDFLKGGTGAGEDIIVKGDAEASELIYRITLPKSDDEAMPPMKDKDHYNPITEQELKVMKSWIKMGASFELLVSELDQATKEAALHVFENMPEKLISKTVLLQPKLPEVPKVNPKVLKDLNDLGILAMPVAQNTNTIYVNASYLGKSFTNQTLKELLPIADQLVWLNLARTGLTDDGIAIISKFKLLSRLHLENTSITDNSITHISNLPNLEYLNLYSTEVSDSSIENLKKLRNLKKLFLWETNFTQQGAVNLKKHFVDTKQFDSLSSQKKEIQSKLKKISNNNLQALERLENNLKYESENTSDKISLNKKCPVANKPIIESTFSIFEGRKIGFCCIKCKTKFEKDGSVYRSKIENFKASDGYLKANSIRLSTQAKMEQDIEELQQNIRFISEDLNKMGPQINLGWIKNPASN